MQAQADWRHMVAAAIVLVLILVVGWRTLTRSAEPPRAAVPAGPNARMRDAPEHPPAAMTGTRTPLPSTR